MRVSKKIRKRVADMMGLSENQLFNQVYRSTEDDLTTRLRFENPLGERVTALEWDSSREVSCGDGLHFVWGHPLLAEQYASRIAPRFFRMPWHKRTRLVPSVDNDGKFRSRAAMLTAKNELGANSPEFSVEILTAIARNSTRYRVYQCAIKLLKELHGVTVYR